MPSRRHSDAMLSSPRSPSMTIRIYSSAENRRRVLRRISRTAFSADAFFSMDSLSLRSLEPSLRSPAHSVQTRLTAHTQQLLKNKVYVSTRRAEVRETRSQRKPASYPSGTQKGHPTAD